MLTVACAWWTWNSEVPPRLKGIYTKEYVERLYRGVKRNLTRDLRFVCLTDAPPGTLDPGIEAVPFLADPPHHFWHMNELLRPEIAGYGLTMVLGLDTIVCGSLDDLATYAGDFALLSNPKFPKKLCNGVSMWRPSGALRVWEAYRDNGDELAKRCTLPAPQVGRPVPSEQELWNLIGGPDVDRLDQLFPGQLTHFHWEYMITAPANQEEKRKTTRIFYFGGDRKPCTPKFRDDPVVKNHWV